MPWGHLHTLAFVHLGFAYLYTLYQLWMHRPHQFLIYLYNSDFCIPKTSVTTCQRTETWLPTHSTRIYCDLRKRSRRLQAGPGEPGRAMSVFVTVLNGGPRLAQQQCDESDAPPQWEEPLLPKASPQSQAAPKQMAINAAECEGWQSGSAGVEPVDSVRIIHELVQAHIVTEIFSQFWWIVI